MANDLESMLQEYYKICWWKSPEYRPYWFGLIGGPFTALASYALTKSREGAIGGFVAGFCLGYSGCPTKERPYSDGDTAAFTAGAVVGYMLANKYLFQKSRSLDSTETMVMCLFLGLLGGLYSAGAKRILSSPVKQIEQK